MSDIENRLDRLESLVEQQRNQSRSDSELGIEEQEVADD